MNSPIVWLASYPKSGNTWLRAVYSALRSGGEPNINRLEGPAPVLRAIFDQAMALRSADLTPEEVDTLRPRADEVEAATVAGLLLQKIHDGLYQTPLGDLVVSTKATRAAIYIVRDPRDVAVSWAHHADVPMAAAVERLCSSRACLAGGGKSLEEQVRQRLGTWSEHVRSWTERAPFPVHVMRYEDCLADAVSAFHAAFAFAGTRATAEDIRRAVGEASFERLRAQETDQGFRERQSARNPFFRAGRAGGWRSVLAPELAQQLLDSHGEIMERYGYVA